MIYDVIIVGAGSAGLTAALYASRRSLNPLVLSQDIGGQTATTHIVENYPGINKIEGPNLMLNFMNQAKKFGAEIKIAEVKKIKKDKEKFNLKTSSHESYQGHAVILAFGLSHRHLNVPGEDKYMGKGVVYCATCDAPLYKEKIVSVIGGGNSALEAALLLAKNSPKVYLIHRRDKFRGENVLAKQVLDNKKIEVIYKAQAKEIKGNDSVNKLIINQENKEKEIEVEGVFIEIGFEVKADFIKDIVKLDKKNQIVIDQDCRTSEEGIFAAGDVTNTSYKQIVISAGQGAKAALSAHKYLQQKGLAKGGFIDWGKRKGNS
ncbi:MAG: thioredoxin-disulfide reductase [Patescibacteria group bacterium]|nr:thioredoxin-disulfide reductase [Patescibacteria group bacterium]